MKLLKTFLILLLSICAITSCTLQKRRYLSGYYIDRHSEHSRLNGTTDEAKSEHSYTTSTEEKEIKKEEEEIQNTPPSTYEQKEFDTNEPEETQIFSEKEQQVTNPIDQKVGPGGKTPADKDAEIAVALFFGSLVFSLLMIGAIYFAIKAKNENGKDGYEFSESAKRKANLVLVFWEVILGLLILGLILYIEGVI